MNASERHFLWHDELLRSRAQSRKDFKKCQSTNEIPEWTFAAAWRVTKLANKKQGYMFSIMVPVKGSANLRYDILRKIKIGTNATIFLYRSLYFLSAKRPTIVFSYPSGRRRSRSETCVRALDFPLCLLVLDARMTQSQMPPYCRDRR